MAENKYLQWLSGSTPSIYWHDSADRREQLEAFEKRCRGHDHQSVSWSIRRFKTTAAFGRNVLAALPKGLHGDERVQHLIRCVTGYYAQQTLPIYQKGETGKRPRLRPDEPEPHWGFRIHTGTGQTD